MLRLALTTAAVLVATPATASADRAGDGPIRAPGLHAATAEHHVTATLRGPGWLQTVGALAGTPALGSYANPTRRPCAETVHFGAIGIHRRPVVRGRRVTAGPALPAFAFDHHGHHGAVTWWSGPVPGGGAAAYGVQRAPAELRGGRIRWILYRAVSELQGTSTACAAGGARSARTIRTIARTMHLASGPVVPVAPVGVA